jgi:hypothetical protein
MTKKQFVKILEEFSYSYYEDGDDIVPQYLKKGKGF